jgi:hypothetical protein
MPYPLNKYKTIITAQEEKDEFAIEFAEWCDKTTTQVSKGEWANWLPDAKNCLTSKKLLEKFKKQQLKKK